MRPQSSVSPLSAASRGERTFLEGADTSTQPLVLPLCRLLFTVERELQARQQEIQSLRVRIENQELSAEDVEQMAKERVRLNEQVQLAAQRQKEIQANIWRQETTIAEQMDAVRPCVVALQ